MLERRDVYEIDLRKGRVRKGENHPTEQYLTVGVMSLLGEGRRTSRGGEEDVC